MNKANLIVVRIEDRTDGGQVVRVTGNNAGKRDALDTTGRAELARIMRVRLTMFR